MTVPKIIWMLWLQGFNSAPPLVEVCIKSWERHNPDWSLRLLTQENVREHLDAEFCDDLFSTKLPHKKIANIIRLALIARHGGIWVDTDCFCTCPLDSWIQEATAAGFFAFRFTESDRWLIDEKVSRYQRLLSRTDDRVLANWFLAAAPGSYIPTHFSREHFKLLKSVSTKRKSLLGLFGKVLMNKMKRNSYLSSMTGNPEFIRKIGRYPFYVFHYHFAYLLRTDPAFRDSWVAVKPSEVKDALAFSKTLGLPVDQRFKDAMKQTIPPVYKFHSRRIVALQEGQQTRWEWLRDDLS